MEQNPLIDQPLSCVITFPTPRSSRGGKIITRIVSIRELIVDSGSLYKIVRDHVFSCDKCNPIMILKTYLNRRINMHKFNGFTSGTLVKLVISYNKKLLDKKAEGVPIELMKEFIWRSGNPSTLIKYEKSLSNMEIWKAVNLLRINVRNWQLNRLRGFQRFRLIESLMDGKKPLNDKEIDDLMAVAMVNES